MIEKNNKYSIIFKQVEELSSEEGEKLSSEEIKEYDEINELRKIVLELEAPQLNCFSST